MSDRGKYHVARVVNRKDIDAGGTRLPRSGLVQGR